MWSHGWFECRLWTMWKAGPYVLARPRRWIIDCLRQSRPFADKVYVISNNSRWYDAQSLLRRFLELRWVPKLIMDGTKILRMVVENLHFLDLLNYLPVSLKSMPKSFDLTCKKGYCPHFFNTANNLDYVGPHPEPKFCGADFMSGDERAQFSAWYEAVKDKIFNNREELLAYWMDDVNVLRQARCAFRNLILKLVKMDTFREAITILSICNKVFGTVSKAWFCRYYPERGLPYGGSPVCWGSSMAGVHGSNT